MNLPDVRLQQAAVVLAEELNFTRAADRLHISQSALSRQIASLEDEIGLNVFIRRQRSVELTEPGQFFIRGCIDAQTLLERAVRLAKSAQDSVHPHITVGHSPYADPKLVSLILSIHLPLYPNLRLRMESMYVTDLVHSVLTGELDLAIIAEPPPNPDLTLALVSKSPLCVMMPADHAAADKSVVSLSDFAGEAWIMFQRRAHPALYARVFDAGSRSAVSPSELHHYLSPDEAVRLISQNFGVAFIAAGIAELVTDPSIAVRPLSELSLHIASHLVLRADQSSRIINDFGLAFLRRVAPKGRRTDKVGQLTLSL